MNPEGHQPNPEELGIKKSFEPKGLPNLKRVDAEDLEVENSEKRKPFFETDGTERTERWNNLASLFMDKEGDRAPQDEETLKKANYLDFWRNVYKYTDKIQVTGKDAEASSKIFTQAKAGNELIKLALRLYTETKKNQASRPNNMDRTNNDLSRELWNYQHYKYGNPENGQLDVPRLTKLFEQCAAGFIDNGNQIGRPPAIEMEDIQPLKEDLEAILIKVNQFR